MLDKEKHSNNSESKKDSNNQKDTLDSFNTNVVAKELPAVFQILKEYTFEKRLIPGNLSIEITVFLLGTVLLSIVLYALEKIASNQLALISLLILFFGLILLSIIFKTYEKSTQEMLNLIEKDALREQKQKIIYQLSKSFHQETLFTLEKKGQIDTNKIQSQSLMSRLRDIKIDAPEDFSTNYNMYINGEKHKQ